MFKKSSDTENSDEAERKTILVEPPVKPRPLARLRTYFLTGIVVTAPIAITICPARICAPPVASSAVAEAMAAAPAPLNTTRIVSIFFSTNSNAF